MKGSVIADHLAYNAREDYESLKFDFPDEDVLSVEEGKLGWWTMYFDGAVNVCGNGAGAVIISPDKKQYPVSTKLQFGCTNNTAEYEACILGLETALELNVKKIDVLWGFDANYLSGKRGMANQRRKANTLPRISIYTG